MKASLSFGISRILVLVIALGFAQTALAIGPQNYTYTTTSGASIVPGTTDIGLHADDSTLGITLPFPVIFYNQVFSTVNVSSNGNIQFLSTSNATVDCIPTTGADFGIAPFWTDLYTVDSGNGEGIFTSVSGVAPNRIFNIEWRTQYCCSPGVPIVNLEARLYESQRRIDFIYGNIANQGRLIGIGVQRDTGSQSTVVSCGTTIPAPGTQYTFTIPQTCTPPPPNMVAWWRGDGNADDSVGGHNGSLLGGASFAAGEVSQAFSFDGASAQVSVPNSPAWDFGSSDFTIDTWVEFNAISGGDVLVAHDEGAGEHNKWFFWHHFGDLEFLFNEVGVGTFSIGVPFSPSPGQWYHLAVARSGGTYRFYVDGVQVGGDQGDSNAVPAADAPLTFGKAEESLALNGLLDEVEIFNRALSAQEITDIFIAGSAGKCKCTPPPENMISWWPGEGDGNDIQDGNNLSAGDGNGFGFATGEVGQAFSFDGTQFATAGNPTNLNITGDHVTIDGWIKPNTLSASGHYFGKALSSGHDYAVILTNGGLYGVIRTASGEHYVAPGVETPGSVFIPPAGVWTHVALTYDGANMRLYANGIEIGFLAVTGNIASVGAPFNLGGRADGFDFDGQVDEVEVFDNALLPEDIAKIYHAGSAGKCRPCTPPPPGMIDWWPGDGNAFDIAGIHNGTFQGNAGISVGKVGSAFSFDGTGDYIDVGDVDLPGTFTIDAWINPDSWPASRTAIIEKQGTFLSYALLVYNNGALEGYVSDGLQNAVYFTAPGTIVTGGWQHVAMTYDVAGSAGARILLYVNGANVATTPESDGAVTPGNEASSAKIGFDAFNDFDGLIDEVELFNRVLSPPEISSIYDAGSGGKCKPAVPAERQLANISSRAAVGTGDNVAIGGFIIHSDPPTTTRSIRGFAIPKDVLIRGIGPSLGITGQLADPFLELHDGNGALMTSNDDWQDDQGPAIQATGLAPSDPKEAAILATLNADNAYTAILSGVGNTTGIGLVEVYDLQATSNSHLANISTRAFVSTGDDVLIGGIIVQGGTPARVLLRGIGPSLTTVSGPVLDPFLELHDTNGALIDSNDDWGSSPDVAAITATGLAPPDPKESAILFVTAPGNYTAIVKGVGGGTGVGLVEAYNIGPTPPPPPTWYQDADGDGYGNPLVTVQAYSAPPGYVANNTDCNDSDASVHPGATETCNGVDDNCDGQIDEGVTTTFYQDADSDGYGNPLVTVQACSAPPGYVANNTDCNDSRASVHPGATEVCNGIDDNCDGFVDEGCP